MKIFCFPFPLLTLSLHFFTSFLLAMSMTNFTTDKHALLALKSSISFENPHNLLARNWTNNSPFCTWIGVTCGTRHRRVTALILSNMSLTGTVSPQLGNLSFLIDLDLSNNNFRGHFPNIARLHRLKSVNISYNMFDGEIPTWILGELPKLQQLVLGWNNFDAFSPRFPNNMSKLEILDLTNNSIAGMIPFEIGRFSNLKFLSMSINRLSGIIPSTIANLTSLQLISFSYNYLFGNIPKEIGDLPQLEIIYLGENQLSGFIPFTIFNNSILRRLDLQRNNLTGSLPLDMCHNLPKLELLWLHVNQLFGQLPTGWSQCKELKSIILTSNKFSGYISREIGNSTLLQMLGLALMNLEGSIPWEIGNLPNLEMLDLGNNRLTGSIPQNLFNITTMKILYLSFNSLSGIIPSNIGHCLVNIEEIYLVSNRLSGEIPKCISNASEIIHLELAHNLFSGVIPKSLGNLKNLQYLKLQRNYFTLDISFLSSISNCKQLSVMDLSGNFLGSKLPNSFGNFSYSLQKLYMSNCEITGSIPQGIGNLSSVILLALDNNNFRGSIPTTLKELQNLQVLYLEGNILNISIPGEFCQMKNLGELSLSNNQLYGLLPPCLGNLTSLRILYLDVNNMTSTIPSTLWSLNDILELNLSSNDFNGFLPQEINNLRALTKFDLSWNKISGNIPSAIGSLQTLEFLDLSHNTLSGMIPKSMELLIDLKYLNVSYNRLQGEIPSGGPFINFTFESFAMNDALCGRSNLKVPPCIIKKTSQRSPKKLIVLKFILPIIVVTILLLTCLIILRYKRKKHGDSAENELSTIGVPRRISYYEILQATNNFDESNFLGKGSFGSVFKGILSSGSSVAIKVFNFHLEAASRSFDVECEAMRNIRHRNLIKIISSCSNNVDFRALVMEFMPNGSLEKWLYAHNYCLDFLQRLNIMIDVASALEYLHNGSSTRLVHCDLKPSNVLLDDDMVAHVSDFGIAKLLDNGQSKTHTNTLATLGYIAPEYGSRGIVSTKGDVYSYGIMLMETFTRKKPTNDMFVGVLSMKSWVNESVPHATIQIMDSNLLSGEERHITVKVLCISSLMELALNCCDALPEERINMEGVLAALNKIKIKFMATIIGC
ncbi:Receptor-like protein kinase [Quillaja saponaria]|uniref:non-specific serine/threonine protein kinase n=1 Tax=Quillaja saponaria TaxID=32244 RepID=A0AAD7KWD5_QUISA|nr:Receptor-like protein kinase [Quillaja saponaria]